jgi:hypothetical protein
LNSRYQCWTLLQLSVSRSSCRSSLP